jgi:hypothetical protein
LWNLRRNKSPERELRRNKRETEIQEHYEDLMNSLRDSHQIQIAGLKEALKISEKNTGLYRGIVNEVNVVEELGYEVRKPKVEDLSGAGGTPADVMREFAIAKVKADYGDKKIFGMPIGSQVEKELKAMFIRNKDEINDMVSEVYEKKLKGKIGDIIESFTSGKMFKDGKIDQAILEAKKKEWGKV